MKIDFTKEDIEQIRKIARNEIVKVIENLSQEMFKQTEKDYLGDLK